MRPLAPAVRIAATTLAVALLAACETALPPPKGLFEDARFAPPQRPIESADELFELSPAMKRFMAAELRTPPFGQRPGPQALVFALEERGKLKIDYDSMLTRDAAQTFADRKGNCLSLVLMTSAFAKALRLDVTYQTVDLDEVWSRSQDIAFLSAHVNIVIGRRPVDTRRGFDPGRIMTVDFVPDADLLRERAEPISEDTIVAMYMNNRAAEALATGLVDDAYWWARAAVLQAPDFSPAYNTLGVVYLRHGDFDAAEAMLRRLVLRDPKDRQALANLGVVLERLGRGREADEMRARLARLEPIAPFHYYLLGMDAMRRGDFKAAREEFAKEVDRADYNSEFHFWLGLANLKLGDVNEARKQIALAMVSSTDSVDRDIYASKLEKLRSLGMH